ncbi:protein of unknown function [Azospirillum lipoferum 4B]|uniref:Uncharacterized protein n=1 Tax=Azospirillum lipoferum (strain 4B) TaxID=862719 RepID=G7Z3S3_AZOL4|nr:protein of unknown function [Azospirillum lipoferum 4B]
MRHIVRFPPWPHSVMKASGSGKAFRPHRPEGHPAAEAARRKGLPTPPLPAFLRHPHHI